MPGPVIDEGLFGAPTAADVSLEDQIACVERELSFRRRVYARRVAEGKMTLAKAELEELRMLAVLQTLERIGSVNEEVHRLKAWLENDKPKLQGGWGTWAEDLWGIVDAFLNNEDE